MRLRLVLAWHMLRGHKTMYYAYGNFTRDMESVHCATCKTTYTRVRKINEH